MKPENQNPLQTGIATDHAVARDAPGNATELVRRTLAGQSVGRPVTGPLAVHYCAGIAGISLRTTP